jgi:hypothetical protein
MGDLLAAPMTSRRRRTYQANTTIPLSQNDTTTGETRTYVGPDPALARA